MSFLVLFVIYILYLVSLNRERGVSSAYYELLPGRIFPRKTCMMYLVYAFMILAYVMSKRSNQEIALFALLLAPVHLYHPEVAFYYSKADADMFRQALQPKNPPRHTSTASYQTTVIPLFRDKKRTKRVGTFYSSANLIASDQANEILQYITYVFDGSDPQFPKGSLVVAINLENRVHDIFPPDRVYRGKILSGAGAYAGAEGVMDVHVTGDARAATMRF